MIANVDDTVSPDTNQYPIPPMHTASVILDAVNDPNLLLWETRQIQRDGMPTFTFEEQFTKTGGLRGTSMLIDYYNNLCNADNDKPGKYKITRTNYPIFLSDYDGALCLVERSRAVQISVLTCAMQAYSSRTPENLRNLEEAWESYVAITKALRDRSRLCYNFYDKVKDVNLENSEEELTKLYELYTTQLVQLCERDIENDAIMRIKASAPLSMIISVRRFAYSGR